MSTDRNPSVWAGGMRREPWNFLFLFGIVVKVDFVCHFLIYFQHLLATSANLTKRIGIGRTDLGRKSVWGKPNWGKSVLEQPIWGKICDGKTDGKTSFGKPILEKTVLRKPIL